MFGIIERMTNTAGGWRASAAGQVIADDGDDRGIAAKRVGITWRWEPWGWGIYIGSAVTLFYEMWLVTKAGDKA